MAASNVVLVQEEPRLPSQTIEVIVSANGKSKFPFPDIQQLKNTTDQKIIIKAIRLITADVLTNGIISGNANAPVGELQKISLVLYAEGWEKGQYIPVLTLNDMTYPGSAFPFRYGATNFADWQNVDWTKSYLLYSNGTVSANEPYCVMFDVQYQRLNNQGAVIQGPA